MRALFLLVSILGSTHGLACVGGNDCCTDAAPCGLGEGDCDEASHCAEGLTCGTDNCCNTFGSNFTATDDCCYNASAPVLPCPTTLPPTTTLPPVVTRNPGCPAKCEGDDSCCTSTCPCLDAGEGDCDSDDECGVGLLCGKDNCVGTTFQNDDDCCTWAPTTPPPTPPPTLAPVTRAPGCPAKCEGDDSCCTSTCPCLDAGEGDCDSDDECGVGLLCGKDNCVGTTFENDDDCCYDPIATTTPAPTTTTSTAPPTPVEQQCLSSLCDRAYSEETLSADVKDLRKSSCNLEIGKVKAITEGAASNPVNVKNVEALVNSTMFSNTIFPLHNTRYTYEDFLRAVGMYPMFCKDSAKCAKTLATLFAHIKQETNNLENVEEGTKNTYCNAVSLYECKPGKKYYGRGAIQLTTNDNYAAFSTAIFGNPNTLLEQPELLTESWLLFSSALWLFMTPLPPMPSMFQVVTEEWKPNAKDTEANLGNTFGTTIMVISGEKECGASAMFPSHAMTRGIHYTGFADKLSVTPPTSAELSCATKAPFPANGAAAKATYWDPQNCNQLTKNASQFSALLEGQQAACKDTPVNVCKNPPPSPPAMEEQKCTCSCDCKVDPIPMGTCDATTIPSSTTTAFTLTSNPPGSTATTTPAPATTTPPACCDITLSGVPARTTGPAHPEQGEYIKRVSSPIVNSRPVFKHQTEDFCLFYGEGGTFAGDHWRIAPCDHADDPAKIGHKGNLYDTTADTTICPESIGDKWSLLSVGTANTAIKVECSTATTTQAPTTTTLPV